MKAAHKIVDGLASLRVGIEELELDADNARIHTRRQIEEIKRSLEAYGQDQPLVVQRDGMIVRKGNGRLIAMRELGWTHAAALVLDEPTAKAVARGIADNRSADLALWDESALARQLEALLGEEWPTGYNERESEVLIDRLGQDPPPGAGAKDVERRMVCPSCGHEFPI